MTDYINKMSYNDKAENSQELLVWVNRERGLIGQSVKLLSLAELRQSRLLPFLLRSINASYFSQLVDKQLDYKGYVIEIEKYLMEMQDLRVKRSYRQQLLKSEDMSELVKLVLFLIMKQDAKQEYISRILELQEETQVYLMNELKKLQGCIENNVQIKEIHQKIEELENQNEYLSDKLKGLEQQTTAVANMEAALREDNEHFKQQDCNNKREKTEVLEAIGVNHLSKDYLAIYREVQLEQKQAIEAYKQTEANANQLQENNREISDKIEENTLIIGHLDEELAAFTTLYQQVRADAYHHQKVMEKENFPKKSSVLHKPCKSQFDEGHTTTSFTANVLDDMDESLEDIIKDYSGGLMGKLESMYKQISNLQRDISGLKDSNSRLGAGNRKKERLIALAERQFQCFVVNYQLTIRG